MNARCKIQTVNNLENVIYFIKKPTLVEAVSVIAPEPRGRKAKTKITSYD